MDGLLLVSLGELILLGSGRLLQVGPLTVRMWLYLACLGYAMISIIRRGTMDREVALLVLGFVTLTTTSSAIGLLNRAPLAQVLNDVKPQLFFLYLPFLSVAIRDRWHVQRIATLIRVCSLALALCYLGAVALVLLRMIPFGLVYEVLSRSDEFFFRGDIAVFYKGFLYLGVGFCFFAFGRKRSSVLSVLLLATMVLTLTRGLVLASAAVAVLAYLTRPRSVLAVPIYGGLLASGLVVAWPWIVGLFAGRPESAEVRRFDLRVVQESVTPVSLLLGQGLGASVGDRARIEASYLEILHQQGVLGLLFWTALLALLTRDYVRASRRGEEGTALPFYLAALFVYIESATNPFLTNPIGMSMVLVSLTVLKVLTTAAPEPALRPARGSSIAPAMAT